MLFYILLIALLQGSILAANTKKGADLYSRPSGSVANPFPTVIQEKYTGNGINFLVIGDWGQKGPGTGQLQVAAAMKTWADSNKTTFIINVGDSFYRTSNSNTTALDPNDHEGVLNETDPKWNTYWLDVYNGTLSEITWYTVAGNHDWYANVTAEVDYFWDINSRFFIPALYYVRQVTFSNNVIATFIHIDTDPFYYNYSTYTKNDDMKSNELNLNLYTTNQTDVILQWLEQQLINAQGSDWIFVVGHHPLVGDCALYNPSQYYLMYEFPPLLIKYKVSAYFNGHAHELAISVANNTSPVTYFGSGAGGATLGSGCANPTWTNGLSFGFLSINIPDKGDTLYYEFVDSNTTDTPPTIVYSGKINSRLLEMILSALVKKLSG
ncbi:9528_t:CDS:2 [Scutellospora calospora]|uniref:9528_t:CDS:1 n=1 Tax=Scutellospora calospora TaxID=85575 RepID=A0ACA9K8D2_9GLOM|nr:9528_t:CDS:2 [Scutellospora calospora]